MVNTGGSFSLYTGLRLYVREHTSMRAGSDLNSDKSSPNICRTVPASIEAMSLLSATGPAGLVSEDDHRYGRASSPFHEPAHLADEYLRIKRLADEIIHPIRLHWPASWRRKAAGEIRRRPTSYARGTSVSLCDEIRRPADSPLINSRAVSSRRGKALWFPSFAARQQSWFPSLAARPRLWPSPAGVRCSRSPRVLHLELTNLIRPSSCSPHSSESGLSEQSHCRAHVSRPIWA
jgi:hypothetical protein